MICKLSFYNPLKPLLFLLMAVVFCSSCSTNSSDKKQSQNDQTENATEHEEDKNINSSPEAPPENMSSLNTNEQVYAWVDRLNIREKPTLSGKVVASATEQEALEFTGEKSSGNEIIVLRGVAYDEPWLKVKTKDGKEGWVFGGAVKRKDETKGNDPMSKNQFFFPQFGRFDLSTWKKVSSNDGSGGDAEVDVSIYKKGSRMLEITISDVGEYGYSRSYKLMESDGKALRTRDFRFEGDGMNELTETINIYTSDPPKKYTRTQKLGKHFMQLNEKPVMANSTWVESTADALPKAISIGNAPDNCPSMDNDSGCSCDFKVGSNYVFRSDYENGCLNLDGNTVAVSEVVFEDERTKLIKQSQSKNWIVLNEIGEDLIFGEKLEMGSKYEEHRAELVQTLLVMDEMPSEISYQSNGTVGMGYRAEVRDMCNEAIKMAKEAKSKGESGPPSELRFKNADYKVHFIVKSTRLDDGGGNYYEGTMEVKSGDGQLLGSKQVKGHCGC